MAVMSKAYMLALAIIYVSEDFRTIVLLIP